MTIGYIAGISALLVALPSDAVAGPDGFVHGIQIMTARLKMVWLLVPMALFVALNAVGSAAAYLSSTSRLPFAAGIDHCLPPAFGWIHPRYRTPWVAIGVYGLAGILVTLLGQAGTNVRGAYEVLVSMAVISYFLPYLFLFGAMIRLQSRPAGPQVRRVPGGKPVAVLLGMVGLASTAMTILLSAVPAPDEPNKPLALAKVVGGTVVLVAAGLAVFLFSRWKTMRMARARI
jgi:amino acid transporter